MFYLTISISSDYDVYGVCSQFLVLGQAPRFLDMVLVDIRLPSEITSMGGAIKAQQNINIPRGWLEYRITRVALSKDTPIVVYCGAGIRSPLAADTLQKMGYTNVKNYSAGFIGWRKAKLPIAK